MRDDLRCAKSETGAPTRGAPTNRKWPLGKPLPLTMGHGTTRDVRIVGAGLVPARIPDARHDHQEMVPMAQKERGHPQGGPYGRTNAREVKSILWPAFK
jgi:hypothetical protein